MKKITFIFSALSFIVLFSIISCDREEGSYTEPDNTAESIQNMQPDSSGNLYISNRLTENLYLYHNEKIIREIPAETEQFLLNIENSGTAVELKLWRKSDIKDVNNPAPDAIYRKWAVVLSTGTDESERAAWIIKDGDSNTASGTLTFHYPEAGLKGIKNIYSVDVFLNSKSGTKVTSLSPGMYNRKVGFEYGLHVVYFRYWYSDPNSTTGSQEVSWTTQDQAENNFSIVINAFNDTKEMYIPVYVDSEIGRTATINFTNKTGKIVQLYANNDLIEKIVISDQATQGMSILEADGNSYAYVLPEGEYTFQAKDVNGTPQGNTFERYVCNQYETNYEITTTSTFKTLTVNNTTTETITIHNAENNEYLGFLIEKNSSKTISIKTEIDSIYAQSYLGYGTQYFNPINSSVVVNELTAGK